jgi:hypothetical protein
MLTAFSGDPRPHVLACGGGVGFVVLVRYIVHTAIDVHVSKDTERSESLAKLRASRKRK